MIWKNSLQDLFDIARKDAITDQDRNESEIPAILKLSCVADQ